MLASGLMMGRTMELVGRTIKRRRKLERIAEMRGACVKMSVVVFAGLTLAACSAGSFIALDGAPVGIADAPKLDGVYKATVMMPMLGPVHARMTAEPTQSGFKANTRPGVAWNMIGGIEGMLGQIFAPFLFPGGVILTWESNSPATATAGEGTISAGTLRNARMHTRMIAADQPVELYTRDGRRVGLIHLEPAHADDPPFADYPALAVNVEEAIRTRLYDPSLAQSSGVRSYFRHLHRVAEVSSDDIEFIFGVGAAAHRHIKFPWPIVAKKDDPSLRPENWDASDLGTMRINMLEEVQVASVKVEAFIDAHDVDRMFEEVISMDAVGLKFELLNTPGVTMSSLRILSWLTDEPIDIGTFYTSEHREAVMAGEIEHFPTIEITTADSIALAESALDLHGAVNIIVHPGERRYDRPVAAVTSEKTATSAVPMIWALKHYNLANVHGMATAPHPQISRPVDIGQGWVVWVASADYRPPTGERMDRGVEPTFPDRDRTRAKTTAAKRIVAEAAAQPRTRLTGQPAAPGARH